MWDVKGYKKQMISGGLIKLEPRTNFIYYTLHILYMCTIWCVNINYVS